MTNQNTKRSFWKRFARISLKTALIAILVFLVIFLLILTPPVQNLLRKKAVVYLENTLHTKVRVGKIYVGLPKKVVLEDIYVEDLQKDTLLMGGKIKADISLFKLLRNELEVNQLELEGITAKIKRHLPDTVFNFQFVIDAFAPAPSKSTTRGSTTTAKKPTDSAAAMKMVIRSVTLDNIRFIYDDVVSGSDVEARLTHFDSDIDTFDPVTMTFDIPNANIEGLNVRIRQYKPLVESDSKQKDIAEASKPIDIRLRFKEIALKKINLDYRNDVSATYSTINIGDLAVHPENIDLLNQRITLRDITVNNTRANIQLGKKQQAAVVKKEVKEEVEARAEAGWAVSLGSLQLNNTELLYDDSTQPRLKKGMDYAHMHISDLDVNMNNISLNMDTIAMQVKELHFKEQSGFTLEQFRGNIAYNNTGASATDLYVKTPGTVLQHTIVIRYPSLEAVQKNIGSLQLDVDLKDSKLLVNDLLTIAPQLASKAALKNAGRTLYINSRVKGRVSNLDIDRLQLQGLQDTRVDVAGTIRGLPDINKTSANLVIRSLKSSRRDIDLFLPPKTIPDSVAFPEHFSLTGTVNGNQRGMTADLSVATDLGDADINGTVSNIMDAKSARYDATVKARKIELGKIMQDERTWGPISAEITAKGQGYDPRYANASVEGVVTSAVINNYTYNDLKLNGSVAGRNLEVSANITDPNINISLNGSGRFDSLYPSIKLVAMIDSIKTFPLHLTADSIVYHGKIDADFASTNPDSLNGKLLITESILVQGGQRTVMDTMMLMAGPSDSGQYIQFVNEAIYARMEGRYQLTKLGTVFQQAVQPYFAVSVPTDFGTRYLYDFTINAKVFNRPVLKSFVPDLERMDSLSLQSHFSSLDGWNASISAPNIDYATYHIRKFDMNAGTNPQAIVGKATIGQISSGSMVIYNTTVDATLANDAIDFVLNIKDRTSKTKYNVKGVLANPQFNRYTFSFKPDSLLLNYQDWTINNGNRLIITPKYIAADSFVLSRQGQQLSINSFSQTGASPIETKFTNFRLGTITGFVQTDSTLADGTINGAIRFDDIMTDPVFAGNLTIQDLTIKNDTAGNVAIVVNNKVQNTYSADITITGRGNDVKLAGNYYMKPGEESRLDMLLDIKELPMKTVEAFSAGAIRRASGSVKGKFDVRGTLAKPSINGNLNFDKTAFNVSTLNNYFAIDQESFVVNNQGLRFDKFEIKDSAGNALVLDGTATTTNFKNYKFNLSLQADNFQALNSNKWDNDLFYGQLFFDSRLFLKGTEQRPVIDGRITVNDKTKMTIVLPQAEPGVVQRKGVIEFVDKDNPLSDSLFINAARYDSLNRIALVGMDITANIQVNKEAEFSLIVDQGNGDFINIKGDASISAGVDPSGKINLTGSYEIEEGTYDLTFNFLHRKFLIQKGSKLVWQGEPTEADVNITAKYIANTSPLDLVKNELGDIAANDRNRYLQKLPFEVNLTMTGKLLQPTFSFDIILPEDKSYVVGNEILTTVRNKLDVLRQQEGEMNKQVFSLLLLNRFTAENPFASSQEGPTAGSLARQSVSKLLTEQLNRLAEDLISGVNLNFDVEASSDYTTGERRDRTDLNVSLSKQLMSDRLSITVGSNFELEGPQNSNQQASNIAGNIALNYRLSKDGRYMLRAYRKNDYQGVIDGYIIETGVGFIITVDYNRFRQIFRSSKKREERRRMREQNQNKPALPPEASSPKTSDKE